MGNYLLFICLSVLISFSAHAIPKKVLNLEHQILLETLKLPYADKMEILGEQNPSTLAFLKEVPFSDRYSISFRWKALVSFAQWQKGSARTVVRKAIQRPEWFLRNAGLLAFKYISEREAAFWAIKLLKEDKSLIVRTAAVDVLRELRANKSVSVLWKELSSKKNFRGKQSLWIRHNIVSALGELSSVQDRTKFIKLLKDSDLRVRKSALRSLNARASEKYNASFWLQSL